MAGLDGESVTLSCFNDFLHGLTFEFKSSSHLDPPRAVYQKPKQVPSVALVKHVSRGKIWKGQPSLRTENRSGLQCISGG